MKRLFSILYLSVAFTFWGAAQTWQVKGTVSSGNVGIPNVVVSDGTNCVKTDAGGSYCLEVTPESRFVFISTPSGYLTAVSEKTIPQFYLPIERESEEKEYDFHLERSPYSGEKHVFFVQADVQAIASENLKDYVTFLSDYHQQAAFYNDSEVFGIDCGDMVGDTPSLFSEYIEAMKKLDMPVYRAIGNHDMDYYGRTFETSCRTFEKYFGPTYYSFNKGKVHYIVLNNNFYIGRDFYYMGYIDERTFQWLEKDLSFIKKGTPVVVAMHIPTRLSEEQQPFQYDYGTLADQTVNAAAFYRLLEDYPTHIVSGHMHYNLNICHSSKLMEHNTAAVCGTWWCSDICLDGTPRGYGVYQVEDEKLTWSYKCIGKSADYQARVYLPGASKQYPEAIIANVWNWDKQWKVEWMEDGKVMGEMTNYAGYDPLAEEMCKEAVKTFSWIAPIKTNHLFKSVPKNSKAKIEVKVTDRFGHVYIQQAEVLMHIY